MEQKQEAYHACTETPEATLYVSFCFAEERKITCNMRFFFDALFTPEKIVMNFLNRVMTLEGKHLNQLADLEGEIYKFHEFNAVQHQLPKEGDPVILRILSEPQRDDFLNPAAAAWIQKNAPTLQ